MKKIIAISLVAILAVGSVFAAFTGNASISGGYNFETGEYGFFSNDQAFDMDIELTTASVEQAAEGDVYASVKASLAVKLYDGDDLTSKPGVLKVGDNLFVVAKITEAKIVGENWYVSILGMPGAPDYAKSAIDTKTVKGDTDDFKFALDDYDTAISLGHNYTKVAGVELGYADYKVGFGLNGNSKTDKLDVAGFVATPEYDFSGVTLQVAGTAYKGAGTGFAELGVSAKVGFANDTLSASVASDANLSIPTTKTGEVKFDADVAANFVYDFVTLDAYYATNVEGIENLVSVQAVTDLNSFDVPVKLTLAGKNLVHDQDLSAKAEFNATEEIALRVNAGYVVSTKNLSTGVGATYAAENFTVKGDVGYAVTVKTEKTNVLTLSASVESSTLVPGATLKLAYSKAEEAQNLLKDQATAQNFGKIVASAKIAF